MTLIPTDESKGTLKKYEELWKRIRYLIWSYNSGNYDEKYMKIKFNSDDDIPLKKMLELYNIMIVARSVFSCDQQILKISFFRCLYNC